MAEHIVLIWLINWTITNLIIYYMKDQLRYLILISTNINEELFCIAIVITIEVMQIQEKAQLNN